MPGVRWNVTSLMHGIDRLFCPHYFIFNLVPVGSIHR